MSKINTFLSYSDHDEGWKDFLLSHLGLLSRQDVEIWSESDLAGGAEWAPQIQAAINKADIAILLISKYFLSSQYIMDQELPALLERSQKEGLVILPILTTPTPWSAVAPELAKLRFLNPGGQPLSEFPRAERDRIVSRFAEDILEIAGALREQRLDRLSAQSKPATRSRKDYKGNIFVSYARADCDFAELVQMKLKDEGFTAWLDTDRLSAGQDWRQEIDESIRGALAVIAIMSPESKQSEYVT